MRSVSTSAEKQRDIEILPGEEVTQIYLRTDHREVEDTEEGMTGTHWECEEAFMACPSDEAPTAEEIEEAFEDWFEYAAEWTAPKQKSLAQLQADIEYIAAMTGVELEA